VSFFATVAVSPPGAAQDEKGQVFDGPGGKLYYEVTGSGSGTPLVAVNGGPGFDHTYLHISKAWDLLAKNRRIIFYDQRGLGRSSPLKPGQSCTLADQLDDLEALRVHLGFERVDLLGDSFGGYLSMAYAARNPERIKHLILVDSMAPKPADSINLAGEVFPEATERMNAAGFPSDVYFHAYLTTAFYSPEKRDAAIAHVAPMAEIYNKQVNQALWGASKLDLNPEIRKFHFPVLVVTGRFDTNVAPVVAYRIHQAIAGSRFVVFERSGHMPFYEEPEAFVSTLEEFLQSK